MACAVDLRDSRKRCRARTGDRAPPFARTGERAQRALTTLLPVTLDLLLFLLAIFGLSIFFVEDTGPIFWFAHELGFVLGKSAFTLDLYPSAQSAFLWRAALLLGCWAVLLSLSGLPIFQRGPRH